MDLLCVSLGRTLEGLDVWKTLPEDAEQIDQALRYARRNKLDVLFRRALSAERTGISKKPEISTENQDITRSTAYILHLIHSVSEALDAAGIRHVFFKGPLQQKILYGDFFAKPCGDADVLVSREDFAEASSVLVESGFTLPDECGSIWWRTFLGEQHLFRPKFGFVSVDLHHRIQQPGCPAPRKLQSFLDNPHLLHLGTNNVPTANLPHIALIAAMNLVKAIYHREAAGSYAMDIVTALRRMTQEELDHTHQEAEAQGLRQTMAFASRASAVTFAVADRFTNGAMELPVPENRLRELLIYPEDRAIVFPKRRKMLNYLCDRTLPDLPVEALRWGLSEGARTMMRRG